jgi:hypothetical protein
VLHAAVHSSSCPQLRTKHAVVDMTIICNSNYSHDTTHIIRKAYFHIMSGAFADFTACALYTCCRTSTQQQQQRAAARKHASLQQHKFLGHFLWYDLLRTIECCAGVSPFSALSMPRHTSYSQSFSIVRHWLLTHGLTPYLPQEHV